MFISSSNDYTHLSSRQTSVASRYSTSLVDNTTFLCKRDHQLIGLDANMITDLEVDLLVEGSAEKSASANASSTGFPLTLFEVDAAIRVL